MAGDIKKMNKHKKDRIVETSAKPKIKTKNAKEEIAVNTIYMMELFRDSMILLRKRNQLTNQIMYEMNVREDTFMRILLFVINVEKAYIRNIATTMRSNRTWWEKEVEEFVEKVYGSKKVQIITPDDFKRELMSVEESKAKLNRLFHKGNILVKP